jgi:hypothetical protein
MARHNLSFGVKGTLNKPSGVKSTVCLKERVLSKHCSLYAYAYTETCCELTNKNICLCDDNMSIFCVYLYIWPKMNSIWIKLIKFFWNISLEQLWIQVN